MNRCRITVDIKPGQRERIESFIKKEYPKLRNISDVVRAALEQFLPREESTAKITRG